LSSCATSSAERSATAAEAAETLARLGLAAITDVPRAPVARRNARRLHIRTSKATLKGSPYVFDPLTASLKGSPYICSATLLGSRVAIHATTMVLVNCALSSQYVFFSSSVAGCACPARSVARDTIVCWPGGRASVSSEKNVQANGFCCA